MLKKISLYSLGFIVVVIVTVTVVFALGHRYIMPVLIPLNDLPTPTGQYAVGTQIFEWTDESRQEWFTETVGDKRRIVVQAWYPTQASTATPLPYLAKPDQWLPALSLTLGLPQFLFSHLKDIDTHSILDAPLHPQIKRTPLVVFSHGLRGMRFQNTAQFEALASRGYIVLSADHTYDASLTLFNDGTSAHFRSGYEGELTAEEFWALRNPQLKTRVADIKFMIDTVTEKVLSNEPLWAAADLDHIGMFGHSYGGATSIVAASQDPRIDATIVLDGWIIPVPPRTIDQGVSTPLLYIGQASWDDPVNYQKLERLLNNSPQQKSILMPGTKHFDFSDTPLFSPLMQITGLAGTIPANELATDLEGKIVSFFNLHLNGQ
jgi:predicted dienelactone hydrolase